MKLKPELLLRAYAVGIFPMAESRYDPEIHWIDPDLRGILPLDGLHVPRRLRRQLRRPQFDIQVNAAFHEVIRECATPAPDRRDTWINPVIEDLYGDLHRMGFAHSVECWREDRLVGGLYGVSLGAAFFGESMFSRESDASKVALVHLVARLRKGGFELLDTQFQTPHLRQFGVLEITREDYRARLARAVRQPAQFPVELSEVEFEEFLQSITQTS
ncbi:MAG: leucyl/phenylalanyl-tRNA--protein transferase [Kiloniellales bacterium]|nr:leucyl/phenylalanyl-tRNA--protein transferase [Kiloniellales bacterium]